jgi:hypothetical protein
MGKLFRSRFLGRDEAPEGPTLLKANMDVILNGGIFPNILKFICKKLFTKLSISYKIKISEADERDLLRPLAN